MKREPLAPEREPSLPTRRHRLFAGLLLGLPSLFWLFSKLANPDTAPREPTRLEDTPENKRQIGAMPARDMSVIRSPDNSGQSPDMGRQEHPWWEKAAVVIAFGLLIVNIFQMRATQKAADSSRVASENAAKSLLDTERTLAATSAAQCVADFNTGAFPDGTMSISCEAGKVDATLLGGSFTLGIRSPETHEGIGEKRTFNFQKQIVSPGKQTPPIAFRIEGLSRSDYIHLSREPIVEGYFIYDDGFNRQRNVPICLVSQPTLGPKYAYGGSLTRHCEDAGAVYRWNLEKQKP